MMFILYILIYIWCHLLLSLKINFTKKKNHFFSDVKKTKQTKLVFLICHLYYYITYGSSSFKKKEKYEIVPRENKKTFTKASDFIVMTRKKIMSFFPSLVVPNSVISI